MKSTPPQRLSAALITGLAAAALATGTATAAPATPDPTGTAIGGTCNTGSSAPLSALQNGSGGNLGAFLWPLENGLNCVTGGSGTPAAARLDAGADPATPVAATANSGSSGSSNTLTGSGCGLVMQAWDPTTHTCVYPNTADA